MNPFSIIDKYYQNNPEAKKYLVIHSNKVAEKVVEIASKCSHLNIDVDFAVEAALLHDIGIINTDASGIGCFGFEPYIKHGIIGFEMLIKEGFPLHAKICKTHIGVGLTKSEITEKNLPIPHEDMLPITIEEKLVCFADKFYSKSEKYLLNPKPIEKIEKEMLKHGEANFQRFVELKKIFGY